MRDARYGGRAERHYCWHERAGERDPGYASGGGKRGTLGEQLAGKPPTPCAEGGTHR